MAPTSQKALLATAVFALLAVVGFAAMQDRSRPAPADEPGRHEPSGRDAEPDAPTTNDRNLVPGQRDAAFDDHGSGRPHPEDARWIEVLVVDQATGAPQPDALVHWHDDSADEYLAGEDAIWDLATAALFQVYEHAAAKAGWRTRANGDGKARITLGPSWTRIAATHGRLYGRIELSNDSAPPVGGWRIELVPDHAVRVRVVDDVGAPCPDIPIEVAALQQGTPDDAVVNTNTPFVLTDADGLATVPHLQLAYDLGPAETGDRSARQRDDDGEPAPAWRVRALLVGLCHAGPVFDPVAPPTEPLELRLPPMGRLRVRAESSGRPIASFESARASWLISGRTWSRYDYREQKVDADGAAMFLRVPLGLHLGVESAADGGLEAHVAGPTHKDQLVDVVLQPSNDRVALSGRLLLPDRQPARNMRIAVRAVAGGSRKDAYTKTDGEGRFVVCFSDVGETAVAHTLWIDRLAKDAPPQRAKIADRTLRIGRDEVGDVVLGDLPLLCAGIVTVGGKPFAETVGLSIQRFRPPTNGKGGGDWDDLKDAHPRKGKDGRFTVQGVAEPGRYRLQIYSQRVLPKEPIEFRLGADDLAIDLSLKTQFPAHLAASVLVPSKTPTQQLRFTLVPEPSPAQQPGAPGKGGDDEDAPVYQGDLDFEVGKDGRLNVRWRWLPPGSYTLRVELWTQRRELLSIADVAVPPPATPDPRLVDIDLRQALRVVELRVLAADGTNLEQGNPFESKGVVFTSTSGEEWRREHLGHDRTELLLAPGPYDLLVCAKGCRPLPVRGDGDKVVARVEPWPRVLVRVTGIESLEELPVNTWACASLVGPLAQDGSDETPNGRSEHSEHLQPDSRPQQIEDGVVRLPIGDGPHTLHVHLEDRAGEVALAAPVTILPSQLETTIVVTAEALQKALAELRKAGRQR